MDNNSGLFVPILGLISTLLIIIVTVWYIDMMRRKYWDKLYENMLQLGIFDIDEPQFVDKLIKRYKKRQKNKFQKPNAFDRTQHPTITRVSMPSQTYSIPISIATELKRMLKRQHEYGNNYIYFQITNKVFGISSVVYSILGLIGSQIPITDKWEMNSWLNPCFAFISIVCVIIALYLSPTTRVSQYITSWKMIDSGINKAISNIEKYDKLNTRYSILHKANNPKCLLVLRIIHQEANEFAIIIDKAEQNLTTDEE